MFAPIFLLSFFFTFKFLFFLLILFFIVYHGVACNVCIRKTVKLVFRVTVLVEITTTSTLTTKFNSTEI